MKLKGILTSLALALTLAPAAFAARTALTPVTMFNVYSGTPGSTDFNLAPVAADNANGNQFIGVDHQIVFVYNSAGVSGTFTIKGAKDKYGRSVDIGPYTVNATSYAAVYLPLDGYAQTGNEIYVDTSASTMEVEVLRLP